MKKILCLLSALFLFGCEKEGSEVKIKPLQNEINKDAANVLFIMDDGWNTQYTEGYRILNKYGLKGNIGVISDSVGYGEYMSEEQLDEMYQRGFDMLNHTKTHPYLGEMSKEEQRGEIVATKEWLKEKGYTRGLDAFIYPYGSYNDETFEVLKEEGFTWARSVIDGDNYEVKGFEAKTANLVTNLDPDIIKRRIDAAIENKSTLLLMAHKFGDEVDEYDMYYDVESFEEIVKYASEKKKKGEVNVLTVSEYLENIEDREVPQTSFTEPIYYKDLTEEEKNKLIDDKWFPIWEDDFSELDNTKWNPIYSDENYNGELQYYLPENIEVKNNSIYLIGKDEKYEGRDYTSAKVTTQDKFELMYGRIEFTAKTNYEIGSFPAVWLLPADLEDHLPEIDIFESVGREYGYAYYVNHWREDGKIAKIFEYAILDNPKEFHKYTMEWNENEIKWFVDDKLMVTSIKGVPKEPMYLIMNLAVGGNWPGSPNEKTTFPMEFIIKDLKVMKEVVR